MKVVVVPTDFSENASHATRYAMHLFKEEETEFLFLHVYGAEVYTTASALAMEAGNTLADKAMEQAKMRMEDFVAGIQPMVQKGHKVTTLTKYNFLTDALNELVSGRKLEGRPVYAIVMGTTGATGAKEAIFGSNAVNVMQRVTNVPMILVPAEAEIKVPKEIVMPSSYKHAYHYDELRGLHEMAKKHGSVIRLMHISDKDEDLDREAQENRATLKSLLSPLQITTHTLTNIDPETAIRCFVQSRDSDMIALMNRKHSFFESITRRSTVKGLGYHSSVPLLIMHAS